MDLVACLDEPLTLAPMECKAVPTGLIVAIPDGYEGQVRPRSGIVAKHRITVPNAPGTIDCDYRGELKVLLINLGASGYTIQSGDRIAQLVIAPAPQVATLEVTAAELEKTVRGNGGFGSTGR